MGDTMSSLLLGGLTSGSIELKPADVAGTNVINVPAVSGAMITTGDTGSVTNGMLAGSISNDKLANSTITIGGQSVALGGSITGIGGGGTGAVFDVVRTVFPDQTLPNGTTKITNFTVRLDTNNGYSTGLSRFTPNVAGYYFISARCTSDFNTGVGTNPTILVYKNGAEILSTATLSGPSNIGAIFGLEASGYVLMNGSTDYLELYFRVNIVTGALFYWPKIQWHGHMVRAA
jgi:hypothetical protein